MDSGNNLSACIPYLKISDKKHYFNICDLILGSQRNCHIWYFEKYYNFKY